MLNCNFNKVALQLYCNRTSTKVFSCKFAAYLPTPFYKNTSEGLLLSILKVTISLPKSWEYTFSQKTK